MVRAINYVLRPLSTMPTQIDLPIDEAIADEEQRGRLTYPDTNTNDLLQRLNLDFGGAIGLGAGFSFADGD